MLLLAIVAYIILVVTASGTLHCPSTVNYDGKYIDARSATAWGFALLSTFGLPWGGVPLSTYFGAGSWTWFAFAGISLIIIKSDGRGRCYVRRCFAILNAAAIMAALCVFMYENGTPGDIPSIEGVGAIKSLEGLVGTNLILVYTCFLISAIASFLPVYSRSERTLIMLSFSYASFLAIAFLPPARISFSGIRPDTAILIDSATYFVLAWLIHVIIIGKLSELTSSIWCRSYIIINTVLTIVGSFLLFTM